MAKTKTPANVVGKQVQKWRNGLGLTQEQFAVRCQLHGFDVSRGTISQIEARLRCVRDRELLLLAKTLGVSIDDLFKDKIRPTRKRKSRD